MGILIFILLVLLNKAFQKNCYRRSVLGVDLSSFSLLCITPTLTAHTTPEGVSEAHGDLWELYQLMSEGPQIKLEIHGNFLTA